MKVKVRLAYDPKVQNCFQIQVWDDPKWTTLVTFNNEMLAKNAFALIRKYGLDVRSLDEATVDG